MKQKKILPFFEGRGDARVLGVCVCRGVGGGGGGGVGGKRGSLTM